ncbi:MAG TPA: ATP-binding protein [Anaerolineaceae bacterium]|nr:ATP-binding protein [Anaerolineaceae bacterium]
MNERVIFPFTAVVGQERMLRSLILNAVDPRIGGVLIRGERGTAKSTAARALAALLPPMKVVSDCRFGCDPTKPTTWCTECRERFVGGEDPMPVETKETPFINLPVSATEDRVVGTLDIERAIQKGERHFEPGVLAAANRGLLYIDEVNLLDDHVVDILLDSAAMGVNMVEREGISFSHPARFILVGTMNPEEGDLRPQLLDRFAFSVEIRGILDKAQRVEIMRRNIAFEADPEAFREVWLPKELEISQQIEMARELVDEVRYTQRDLLIIADLTSEMEVDGHRSDLVILKAARAQAAFEGRTRITPRDIAMAAELALPHRVKAGPFRKSAVGVQALDAKLADLKMQTTIVGGEEEEKPETAEESKKKVTDPQNPIP